jgi:hypothetical protein
MSEKQLTQDDKGFIFNDGEMIGHREIKSETSPPSDPTLDPGLSRGLETRVSSLASPERKDPNQLSADESGTHDKLAAFLAMRSPEPDSMSRHSTEKT